MTSSPVAVRRRGILRGLMASGLALLGARTAAAVPAVVAGPSVRGPSVTLQETHVAGTAYYRADAVLPTLREGQTLILRRQPDNPFDPLAVEVLTAIGEKLGYVPRAANPPYARMLDAGYPLTARITAVRPGRWDLVRMEIGLVGDG